MTPDDTPAATRAPVSPEQARAAVIEALTRIVPDVKRLIQGFRNAGLPVIHTMECHRSDLSDLPPAKRDRGNPTTAMPLRLPDNLVSRTLH